jgi:poly-gamma-glutamate biosynthesis protein PgsC/CapC
VKKNLFTSELAIALTIGVTLSLLFSEFFGQLPGGLVVPGYLALSWEHPYSILSVFIISLLTFVTVKIILGRITILYGRRKFAAMLLTGIGFTVGLNFCIPFLPIAIPPLNGVGVIVPGLMANCYHKQGFLTTIAGMAVLSGITIAGIRFFHIIF